MKRMKEIITQLIKIATKEEMRILPGNLAFFLVLSGIPIITLLGVIASIFGISVSSIIDFMASTFPKDVSDLLIPFVGGNGFDANVLFFMITGFVMASNGAHSIIIASDTLYNIDHADEIKRRVKSVFLTIILVNLIIFILVVLAFGNVILNEVLNLQVFHAITKDIYNVYLLLKWPIAFVLIFFSIKLLYTIAPDKKIPSKYMNKGAVFTTLGWIIVTAIYSFYVSHFANYDIFYGSLSNIIIMMIWVYILSYILVLGIAINTSVYYRLVEETTKHDS